MKEMTGSELGTDNLHPLILEAGVFPPQSPDAGTFPSIVPEPETFPPIVPEAEEKITAAVTKASAPQETVSPNLDRDFLGYIHSFRAIALLYVVSSHCISAFDWSFNPLEKRVLQVLLGNGSVLFAFISGYLFQHLSNKFHPKRYLKTKFTNIVLPYLLLSIPAILTFTLFIGREDVWKGFYNNPKWLQVILFYVTGMHLAPFWFVPMMSIFYVISPLLIRLDRAEVFYWTIPAFVFLSCAHGRGTLPHTEFVYYFSVYFLGMACSHYKKIINARLSQTKWMIFWGSLALFLVVIQLIFINTTMYNINFLQKLTLCFLYIGILVKLKEKGCHPYLNVIADVSFGIYLLHSYVISFLKMLCKFFMGSYFSGGPVGCLIFSIVILWACTQSLLFAKKFLGSKSRMILGS
jgi:surface polysaccharide O-acyltransferase-like enzyme